MTPNIIETILYSVFIVAVLLTFLFFRNLSKTLEAETNKENEKYDLIKKTEKSMYDKFYPEFIIRQQELCIKKGISDYDDIIKISIEGSPKPLTCYSENERDVINKIYRDYQDFKYSIRELAELKVNGNECDI